MNRQEMRELFESHDHPGLECDGATRVFSWLLRKKGVEHVAMEGRLEFHGTPGVVPHCWIQLDDGQIVDYKARMWLPNVKGVPYGVFDLSRHPKALYVGEEAHGFIVTKTMFNILTRSPRI